MAKWLGRENKSLLTNLRSLWGLFGRKQRIQLCGLIFLYVIGAVLETVSISLLFPFMTMMLEGGNEQAESLIFVALAVMLCFIIKSIYLYALGIIKRGYILQNYKYTSKALLGEYLSESYHIFNEEDSSVRINNVNRYTGSIFISIQSMLDFLAELFVIGMLLVYICFLDITISAAMLLIYISLMLVFHNLIFSRVRGIGKQSNESFDRMSTVTREALNGLKEIKLYSRKPAIEQLYDQHISKNVSLEVKQMAFSTLPRYIIESITVAAMLTVFTVSFYVEGSTENMISKLTVLGMVLIRVMPGVTRINNYLSTLYLNIAVLDRIEGGFYSKVKAILKREKHSSINQEATFTESEAVSVNFEVGSRIIFQDVSFAYEKGKNVIDKVSFDIAQGAIVGLKGPSGVGKSTLLNMLIGLLDVDAGQCYIEQQDGTKLKLSEAKLKIGYLPQKVFLLNASLKDNILFYRAEDEQKLQKAIDTAQLSSIVLDLIEHEQTNIGENGAFLSGGQCQRVGLARAVYDAPDILVLDEGTSALDEHLEEEIMRAVTALKGKTIIIASHRESTLKYCDYIIELT